VGTETTGLNYYNFSENTFFTYWHLSDDPTSINSNAITSLFRDQQGIWLGTSTGGVNIYDSNLPAFAHYKTNAHSNAINAFAEDKEGNIWIGTDGGGLDLLNRTNNQITHYIHQPGNKNSLSNNGIVTLLKDLNGNLWIGTYGGGVNYYDKQNNRFYHYTQGGKETDLNTSNIYALLEDDEGKLWIGTLGACPVQNMPENFICR
jgi:ligand-binding sensor domain-containing protein